MGDSPATDKAQPDAKDEAHTRFQEIAFAYAILSDDRRRSRYDNTGNTSDSLGLEEDDFNWRDFYREQWAEAVTGETLNNLKETYQNSEEERRDVLKAYKAYKGKLNKVFKIVLLSNPLEDEDRFRGYIDSAIKDGEVEAFPEYVNEDAKKKTSRHANARKEAKEAKEYAIKIGVYEDLLGNGNGKSSKKRKGDDESALAALIQQRSKGRAANIIDQLEAKYGKGKKGAAKGKTGKKRSMEEEPHDEPPEEAFRKTAARQKSKKVAAVEDDDAEETLGEEDSEEEPEPEPLAPSRAGRRSKRLKR